MLQLEDAVLMELAASARLFGGLARLQQRVQADAQALGARVAWAGTAHAALALVRCGQPGSLVAPLAGLLDPLPLDAMTAVAQQQATLARLGCRTLGDVRRLPRAGLARRVGAALLRALDEALGTQPVAHRWLQPPERFAAQLELPSHVDNALTLQFGAQRLMRLMVAWLAARHQGVLAFSLHWQCAQVGEPAGSVCVRTSQATQQMAHLLRLLREHLAHVRLSASAEALRLTADEVAPLHGDSLALLPDGAQRSQSVTQALERIQVRLGAGSVRQAVLLADHRLEWMQRWQTWQAQHPAAGKASARGGMPQQAAAHEAWGGQGAPAGDARRRSSGQAGHAGGVGGAGHAAQGQVRQAGHAGLAGQGQADDLASAQAVHSAQLDARLAAQPGSLPVPSWLLPAPVRLRVVAHRPQWGGALHLLLGPERVEGGWWHAHVQRDYWLAQSPQAGLLCVFQQRLGGDEVGWFLHGHYA